jgi:hypothetical protein
MSLALGVFPHSFPHVHSSTPLDRRLSFWSKASINSGPNEPIKLADELLLIPPSPPRSIVTWVYCWNWIITSLAVTVSSLDSQTPVSQLRNHHWVIQTPRRYGLRRETPIEDLWIEGVDCSKQQTPCLQEVSNKLLKCQSPGTVYVILTHVFTEIWIYAYKIVLYRFSCTSVHHHTVQLRYVSYLSILFMYAYNPVYIKSSRYGIHTGSLPYSRAEIQKSSSSTYLSTQIWRDCLAFS